MPLRHQEPEHARAPQRANSQGGGDTAVNAPRQAHDKTASSQFPSQRLSQPNADFFNFASGVEEQRLRAKFHSLTNFFHSSLPFA